RGSSEMGHKPTSSPLRRVKTEDLARPSDGKGRGFEVRRVRQQVQAVMVLCRTADTGAPEKRRRCGSGNQEVRTGRFGASLSQCNLPVARSDVRSVFMLRWRGPPCSVAGYLAPPISRSSP